MLYISNTLLGFIYIIKRGPHLQCFRHSAHTINVNIFCFFFFLFNYAFGNIVKNKNKLFVYIKLFVGCNYIMLI